MLELLGGDPEFYEMASIPMPPELEACVTDGFKEVDGCIVPKSFELLRIFSDAKPRIANQHDETSVECSIHEVSIDAYFNRDVDLKELARTGCDFAWLVRRELLRSNVQGPIRIIVSAQAPDVQLRVGPTCTVRFHRLRNGQAWLANDLEGYRLEAIAAFDFSATTSLVISFSQ
jgi:hypothetical protein